MTREDAYDHLQKLARVMFDEFNGDIRHTEESHSRGPIDLPVTAILKKRSCSKTGDQVVMRVLRSPSFKVCSVKRWNAANSIGSAASGGFIFGSDRDLENLIRVGVEFVPALAKKTISAKMSDSEKTKARANVLVGLNSLYEAAIALQLDESLITWLPDEIEHQRVMLAVGLQ